SGPAFAGPLRVTRFRPNISDCRCWPSRPVSEFKKSRRPAGDLDVSYNYMKHLRKTTMDRAAGPDLTADAAAVFDVMTELLRLYQFRDRERVGAHGLTVTQT